MSDLVAIPLPDGRWLALDPEALRRALTAANTMGLGAHTATPAAAAGGTPEKWMTSEELQAATGVHSTTWETRAKTGAVPCMRVGKALRFKLSEVEAAIRASQK